MATARTFTPDLLPEEGLPKELAEKGLYKPAGIGCNHCAFNTKKKGFSGRQAFGSGREGRDGEACGTATRGEVRVVLGPCCPEGRLGWCGGMAVAADPAAEERRGPGVEQEGRVNYPGT